MTKKKEKEKTRKGKERRGRHFPQNSRNQKERCFITEIPIHIKFLSLKIPHDNLSIQKINSEDGDFESNLSYMESLNQASTYGDSVSKQIISTNYRL